MTYIALVGDLILICKMNLLMTISWYPSGNNRSETRVRVVHLCSVHIVPCTHVQCIHVHCAVYTCTVYMIQ